MGHGRRLTPLLLGRSVPAAFAVCHVERILTATIDAVEILVVDER